MFQKLFSDEATRRRHRNAPFAEERERYLQHCADVGGTRATLLVKSTELLWFACHLGHVSLDTTHVYAEVDMEMKAKALASVDISDQLQSRQRGRSLPSLMTFLKAL